MCVMQQHLLLFDLAGPLDHDLGPTTCACARGYDERAIACVTRPVDTRIGTGPRIDGKRTKTRIDPLRTLRQKVRGSYDAPLLFAQTNAFL